MSDLIRFVPRSTLDAKANLREFVDLVKTVRSPFGIERNRFENHAWSMAGLGQKGGGNKFIYFAQLGFDPKKHRTRKGMPSVVPNALLMREPFRSYAKALIVHLQRWERPVALPFRLIAFRYVEAALYEINACTCPTGVTPEVMNRAMALAVEDPPCVKLL